MHTAHSALTWACALCILGDVKSLHEQLREAWKDSGLTLAELVRAAGLEVDETNLGRKLRGTQPLKTDEAEALARALRVTIIAGAEVLAS